MNKEKNALFSEKVKQAFNEAALSYDEASHVQQMASMHLIKLLEKSTLATEKKRKTSPGLVVDLASGTGNSTLHLQAYFQKLLQSATRSTLFIGVDIAKKAIGGVSTETFHLSHTSFRSRHDPSHFSRKQCRLYILQYGITLES